MLGLLRVAILTIKKVYQSLSFENKSIGEVCSQSQSDPTIYLPWFPYNIKNKGIIQRIGNFLLNPALAMLLLFLAAAFLRPAVEPLPWLIRVPFILIDLILIPFLVTAYFIIVADMAKEVGLTRLPVRIRTMLCGIFPTLLGHTLVYILAIIVLIFILYSNFKLFEYISSVRTIGFITFKETPDDIVIFGTPYITTMSLSVFYSLLLYIKEGIFFLISYNPAPPINVNHNHHPFESKDVKAIILHWSDLHLTGSKCTPRIEDGSCGGNAAFEDLVADYRNLMREVNGIVVTGDITDTGLASEWREFFSMVGSDFFAKGVIVPGNHDVNIPKRKSQILDDPHWRAAILRFAFSANLVQGERAWISDNDGNIYLLSSYMSGLSNDIEAFLYYSQIYESAIGPKKWQDVQLLPDVMWDSIFPMAVTLPDTPLVVIVLNSNDRASNVATTAFGRIGTVQRNKLRLLRRKFENCPQIIALHHHISDRRQSAQEGPWFKPVQVAGMGLHDAADFISEMEHQPALLLNGHRHLEYFGTVAGSQLVSAMSSTLGDENSESKKIGFRTLGIGWDDSLKPKVLTSRPFPGGQEAKRPKSTVGARL